jgi:hypothetical protein
MVIMTINNHHYNDIRVTYEIRDHLVYVRDSSTSSKFIKLSIETTIFCSRQW